MINQTAKKVIAIAFCLLVGLYSIQTYYKMYVPDKVTGGTVPTNVERGNAKRTEGQAKPNIVEKGDVKPSLFNIIDVKSTIHSKFECVNLTISPPTPICIYDPKGDIYVSSKIKAQGAFEKKKLLNVLKSLKSLGSDKDHGLIDVGANIGEFTLAAAMSGHQVISVEPLSGNTERIVRAAQLGGTTEKIMLLKNAVSSNHAKVKMMIKDKNVGGSFVEQGGNDYFNCTGKSIRCSGEEYVQTITLDDIASLVKFKSAILKIDIENFERFAFKNASLLFDKIDFPLVYMEWVFFTRPFIKPSYHKDVTALVDFFYSRQYKPYADWDDNFKYQLGSKWIDWPSEVTWKKMY